MRAFIFLFEAANITVGTSLTDGGRYARDYTIDLDSNGQYGFLLGFEGWAPSSNYITKYNTAKDGLAIEAVGRVLGLDVPNCSPISGSRSFVLNGAQRFNTYVTISGLKGIGTVSMKVAPWGDGTGDQDTTLLVSDGTEIRRFPILPYDDVHGLFIKFNNPLAQQIRISPDTSTQRGARIRIDDIRF